MRCNAKTNNQRFQKEHWQKVHHELMESSAERFTTIENDHEISYNCTECHDTKICETWGTCQKCNVPKQFVKSDPSKIVKDFVAANETKSDTNSEEYKEDMRKYNEARNNYFPKAKSRTANRQKLRMQA